MKRVAVGALLGVAFNVAGAALWAAPASAHALLKASQPGAGSAVDPAPATVQLTFTEAPDAKLGAIKVLNQSGAEFSSGAPAVLSDDAATLRIPVKTMPKGTYTVSWRVLSKVDGHLTSGAFAFGVGEVPKAGTAPAIEIPKTSPIGVAGRWMFYVGTFGLMGFGTVSIIAPGQSSERVRRFTLALSAIGLAGVALLAGEQLRESGVSIGALLGTSLGTAAMLRAGPLIAGMITAGRKNTSRSFGITLVAAAGLAIAGHVRYGHAAAEPFTLAKVAVQWVHFAAGAVWIGGLGALLVMIRGADGDWKQAAVRTFSKVAGIGLLMVAVTGTLRALDEVGGLGEVLESNYGKYAGAKAVLLIGLASLGAVNRFRHVRKTPPDLRGLNKVGRAEIVVALVTLVFAGLLASTVPAAEQAKVPKRLGGPIMTTGSDFGSSVRIELKATPGTAGVNRFSIRARDYDSGDGVQANEVSLRFTYLTDASVGESMLTLKRKGNGLFEGEGANLSLDGPWKVTALLQLPGDSREVESVLFTIPAGETIEIQPSEGQPTIYNHKLDDGRSLQIYFDPDRPGKTDMHATFFNAEGAELPIAGAQIFALDPRNKLKKLTLRRFGPGHFASDVSLREGDWSFDVSGMSDSARVRFLSRIEVEG